MVKRSNGDGSVFFRKSDQRWCASLSLPSPDGKPRRVTRTVPNIGTPRQQEAAAKALLTKLKRERDANGDIPTAILNVEKWARHWFNEIAVKDIRPGTAATYRTDIEEYIIPAIGSRQLRKLTPEHVRQLDKYIEAKGLTRSRVRAYRTLSILLSAAAREGHVTRNVATLVKPPRAPKAKLTMLTVNHALKILAVTTGRPAPVAVDRLASRWWAALFTGARQGELLGLEWDRVDFERGVLDLSWQLQRLAWEHGCITPCGRKRGTDCPSRKLTSPADWENRHIIGGLWWSRPKTSKSWRIIPLVSPLREMLEMRLRESVTEPNPYGLVWTQPNGRPIDPSADNRAWHDVLALAGVPDARLHDARHTSASLLRKAGVPIGTIQRIMGHSTAAMSEAYVDYELDTLEDGMTRMAALLTPQTPELTPLQG